MLNICLLISLILLCNLLKLYETIHVISQDFFFLKLSKNQFQKSEVGFNKQSLMELYFLALLKVNLEKHFSSDVYLFEKVLQFIPHSESY